MQRAKAFFYASLGILALATAFHLGARSANGQAGSPIVGYSSSAVASHFVMTPNGDTYHRHASYVGSDLVFDGSLDYMGNFWDGPVQTKQTTWGRVKAERR